MRHQDWLDLDAWEEELAADTRIELIETAVAEDRPIDPFAEDPPELAKDLGPKAY